MNNQISAGSIVSWSPGDKSVPYSDLLSAMSRAQIDHSLAKEMAPRNAFARACKELSENRTIDLVSDENGVLTFQFTAKFLQKKEITFSKECTLSLDKKTGDVSCSNLELATLAQRLIQEHTAKRTSADITRLIQKVFDQRKGDLVPIRRQGGCYFVPFTHSDLLDSVEVLLGSIGGELSRFVIQANDKSTNSSIAKTMSEYIAGLIDEWKKSVQALSDNTSTETLEKRLQDWKDISYKLKAYETLLGGFTSSLKRELMNGVQLIQQKAAA